MSWPSVNLLKYEFHHNNRRFLWRMLNGGFQVYGKLEGESLRHICQCDSAEFAQMIADCLELQANREYIATIP